MALIGDPPKGPCKKYPQGMTSTEANDWLNENILLSPYYFLETGIFQDWIDYQNAAWAFQTGIGPMESVLGFPTEQNFLGESASEDYKLQAGNLNSLDFRDPTHHSKLQAGNLNSLDFRDPTHLSHNTPPSLKREQSWHKDSPSQRPRVESTIAGMSLDIGTVLEGHLTRINLASDYPTGDFDENEIKDARLENRGPEAGSSEEGERKSEGMLEEGNSEEMHLREGEDHRADCDASNLRDLRANLPLKRDEEGRAGLGQRRKVKGSTRRRRQRRAIQRRIDRWVPNKRQSMA